MLLKVLDVKSCVCEAAGWELNGCFYQLHQFLKYYFWIFHHVLPCHHMLLHAPMCYHMLPHAVLLSAMMLYLITAQQPWSQLWGAMELLRNGARWAFLPFELTRIGISTQQWKVINAHCLHGEGYWMNGRRGKCIHVLKRGSRALNNGNSQGEEFCVERWRIFGEGPISICGTWRGGACAGKGF